jgi:hypothetical protein
MIGCTAALTWLLHDRDGTALDAGRKRRHPTRANAENAEKEARQQRDQPEPALI